MSPSRSAFAALALSCLLAVRPAAAYWPHSGGVAVAPGPGNQQSTPAGVLADGTGGMFVAFTVDSSTDANLYLTRVTATGATAPGWPAAGIEIAGGAGNQVTPALVSDGAGGVFVVWLDYRSGTHYDLYAQRVTATGALQAGWPVGGRGVATQNQDKGRFSACSDGAGGVFIAYEYYFTNTDVDIYAAHLNGAGLGTQTTVDAAGAYQQAPAVVADGAGGFYVAYETNAPGNYDIYIARLNASLGLVFAPRLVVDHPADQHGAAIVRFDNAGFPGVFVAWTDLRAGTYSQVFYGYISPTGQIAYDYGYSVTPATSPQTLAFAKPDEQGGYYVGWIDGRASAPGLYVKHFYSPQTPYPNWPVDGRFLGPGTMGPDWNVGTATDGNNGLLLEWSDQNTFSGALYGTHVDAYGTLQPYMQAGGNLLLADPGFARYGTMVSDGLGGGLAVWTDYASATAQVRAQHLDPFLVLGDARPASEGVKDLPADQGGRVRFTWTASWLDNAADRAIGSYWIWRQAPLTLAQQAVARGGAWAGGAAAPAGTRRVFRHDANATAAYAWEFLAQQPANHSARYSYVAATTTDSIAGHNPYTVFMVEAHATSDANAFWASAPDSGYSADNLPPAAPAPFTGSYAPALTSLQWGANHEADLAGYRLYRGGSPAFVPGPGNLVAALSSTAWSAASAPVGVYKLTAVDAHGNESPAALLVPAGVTGVDDAAPRALAFALASPNPSRTGARLRFALPAPGRVRLAIYDAAGREVRTLADGEFAAGEWTRAWDGADASGREAACGLYFARLQAAGSELVLRLVRAR